MRRVNMLHLFYAQRSKVFISGVCIERMFSFVFDISAEWLQAKLGIAFIHIYLECFYWIGAINQAGPLSKLGLG